MENDIKAKKIYSEDEKLRAAYALNMCTVSVSQIVDYNDIYILEQEYNAILNNLNLKAIPKDEALLRILTELLNTITFFRIQDIKKNQVEKEYQQRMKSAIWSAVPSLSVFVSGNPVAMAFSLATTVGTGYMNYRREKVQAGSEKEKAEMELQITAIEQFNALRRELFTTAWRLAAEYDFEDKWRLTEKQIKQYNDILVDQHELKRYARLEAVQDEFGAYPPFWYFFGHAASEVSFNSLYTCETREYYREKAKECFEIYWGFRQINILREDQIMASCALEYIDLLDCNKDQQKISVLLNDAKETSTNATDVLQICAFLYLKIEDNDSAAKLFRYLVNEGYNTVLNAQLLSQIYVSRYLLRGDNESKREYEILAGRINERYLFPFPKSNQVSGEDVGKQFFDKQKEILKKGFQRVCRLMFQKYIMNLNKIIPYFEARPSDEYYSNEPTALTIRHNEMRNYLSLTTGISADYKSKLYEMELRHCIIQELNELLEAIKILREFYDIDDIGKIIMRANKILYDNRDVINAVQTQAKDGTISYVDYEKTETVFSEIITEIMHYVLTYGRKKIDVVSSMKEIAEIENSLLKVCEQEKISAKILAADDFTANMISITTSEPNCFTMGVFGEDALIEEKHIDLVKIVVDAIKESGSEILTKSRYMAQILINGSSGFENYIKNDKFAVEYASIESKVAAFIVNAYTHFDLILADGGIYVKTCVQSGDHMELSEFIPYDCIEPVPGNDEAILLNGDEYRNANLNMTGFIKMVDKIKGGICK